MRREWYEKIRLHNVEIIKALASSFSCLGKKKVLRTSGGEHTGALSNECCFSAVPDNIG